MAKRRKPSDQSLFDDLDTPEQAGRGAPARPPLPDSGGNGAGSTEHVPLHEAAQSRYLNYALSVITARALPDVRDGLKPVQRRILYTMWQQNLTADTRHRKCAKVVGDVMGSFHPHGDAALYETLVRMAQSFSLRYPLVDGSGNFGSLDGDSAAAMRYTECRLARISDEMLTEIEQQTVPFRPNYDGTKIEPVVLPARLPNLLINGATGIAVGMATNIPPHNLGEVCTALIKLLDNEEISTAQLCRYVKGPDFPTGGQILNSQEELKEIYKTGSGSIRLRATWDIGDETRHQRGHPSLPVSNGFGRSAVNNAWPLYRDARFHLAGAQGFEPITEPPSGNAVIKIVALHRQMIVRRDAVRITQLQTRLNPRQRAVGFDERHGSLKAIQGFQPLYRVALDTRPKRMPNDAE